MNKRIITKSDIKIDKYFLLFLVLVYSLYFSDTSPSIFLITSGIFAIILFGWIIFTEFKYSTIKITPILILSITPIFMLGVSAIYHGIVYLNRNYETLGPAYISTNSIVLGYLMVATGLFFQLLGIQIFRPINKLKKEDTLNTGSLKIFNYFIFFLILSKLTEEYFKLGVIQNLLNTIPLSILIFIAINDRDNILLSYRYKRNAVLIGSIILFVANLIMLSKALLLFSIIPLFLFYLLHKRKSQQIKIVTTAALVMILYLLFIQPLVNNARLFLGKYNEDVNPKFLSEYIISGNYKIPVYQFANPDNAVETFLKRTFEINAPAYIYELTERSGFQNGRTLQNIAMGMIPRILWPTKPSIPQGQKFSSEILGFEKVSIGMLIAGELYWNFGFIGIIIGSMLIGLALGFVWKLINPFALKNFFYFTFYVYLLQSSLGGSEFSAVFTGALQLIIVFFVIRFIDLNIIKLT